MEAVLDHAVLRRTMVEEQIRRRGVLDERVLDAFRKVPRHLFVPPEERARAYSDAPLPIGGGQTISQPYMTALMTARLGLSGGETVLEIGTGSGYQTAILCELAAKVFSVERIPDLAARATATLRAIGHANFEVRVADGSEGWYEKAPFDRILVTAACPSVPRVLPPQLKAGGILVAPVGKREGQNLVRVTRTAAGYEEKELGPCVFVPLLGAYGWSG